jgi:hypothetical protein
MKVIFTLLLLVGYIFASPVEEFDKELYKKGEQIFDNKCATCHVKYLDMQTLLKNFLEENNKTLNLKAPTGNQISYRLKSQIGSRDDIEFHIEEINDFLKDYLYNPNKEKTVCLTGVIDHFDTMPSMEGVVSEEEIEEVGNFLYFLEGFNDVNKYYHKDDF